LNIRESSNKAYRDSQNSSQRDDLIFDYSQLRETYYCNESLQKPYDVFIYFESIMGAFVVAAFVYNYFKNKIPWS
jgi:hypothetical protein